MIVHFQIPGKPTGKGRARATRSGHHYTPEKTRNAEAFVKCLAMEAMGDGQTWRPPCSAPVALSIDIAIMPPKSMPKRQRDEALCGRIRPAKKPDCDNIVKLISDALNGIVWVDDSQVVDLVVKKRYANDDVTTVIVSQAEVA